MRMHSFSYINIFGLDLLSKAGTAYIFARVCTVCEWQEVQRIEASDKREGNLFGYSVAIDETTGLAIVGCPHSSLHGFYHELPSRYPYYANDQLQFPLDERLERYAKAENTLAPTGGNLRLVNHIMLTESVKDYVLNFNRNAGAIYIFQQEESSERYPLGRWKNIEVAKITPPDVSSHDLFGTSIAVNANRVIVGATGTQYSLGGIEKGAIYNLNTAWIHVKFAQTEYSVVEKKGQLNVTLHRSSSYLIKSALQVSYFTSDLTAKGVSSDILAQCSERFCGDYLYSTGDVTFEPGQNQTSFIVHIIDDSCKEDHMKYFQLQLRIPNGGPIVGEKYRAQVRIDDDDWSSDNCHSII